MAACCTRCRSRSRSGLPPSPSRSTDFVAGLITIILLLAAPALAEVSSQERIVPRGTLSLPDEVADQLGHAVRITGLSGIAWVGGGRYAAVMDNSPQVLFFDLQLSQVGRPRRVENLRLLTLESSHDYEGIAWRPTRPGSLFLAEEDTPAIREFDVENGRELGQHPVPEIFLGRRPNRGFESLAVEPDARHAWVATEEAVPLDGPASAEGVSTVVRIARVPLTPRAGPDGIQLAYAVDPPHAFTRLFDGDAISGLSELVWLEPGRLLALERSGGPGLPPFSNRLYAVATAGAIDVAGVTGGLAERPATHVAKDLIWRGELGLNLEGLALGPRLANGSWPLVGVADNGGLGTPNSLVVLEYRRPPPPASVGVVAAVGAVVAVAMVVGGLRRGWVSRPG
jgi:hypothetical protein